MLKVAMHCWNMVFIAEAAIIMGAPGLADGPGASKRVQARVGRVHIALESERRSGSARHEMRHSKSGGRSGSAEVPEAVQRCVFLKCGATTKWQHSNDKNQ